MAVDELAFDQGDHWPHLTHNRTTPSFTPQPLPQQKDVFARLSRRGVLDHELCDQLACSAITEVVFRNTPVSTPMFNLIAERCPLLTSFTCTYSPSVRVPSCREQSLMRLLMRSGATLTAINLSNCRFATDRTIATIVESCPHIESLDISRNQAYSPGTLCRVWELEQLSSLSLSLTHTDDSVFEVLEMNAASRPLKLKHIQIAYCPNITDQGMEWLLRNCRELTSINMKGSTGITHLSRQNMHRTWTHQPTYLSWSIPA
ncbi:hypothetical protein PTSG_10312 [Salpingoeca rosetta]|uniref:RNI-like protein n=1 Tax=Salpingoeca rosetta (strain ATCC 50818 / BSB-021) TaxID=946362 RepID=F2UQY3_SALR5|nr:uncharacterized protein PTSG_10312 [Salpingoeca rosetta]EGD80038.1 hypothetical protein PTSG_10312 [Salpingoeca rosetta]|eukprot:XP_004988363.1 hypothetical protein PTSG_10312 [Salpingoeca rosetta]